jgi:hypothetical protein
MGGTAQAVLFINAGSRAAYGDQQELTIDSKGNGRYYLRQVNGPVKDSVFFSISPQQLQSFFNKAETAGFFSLNNEYKGKAVDGAGIYISMNNAGKKHYVALANTDLLVINELVSMLNDILATYKIRINYGQFVTK